MAQCPMYPAIYLCQTTECDKTQVNKVIGWNSKIFVPGIFPQQMAPWYVCMY